MKILIHALSATMGGAMRHLSNFLPELGRQDQSNEYVVLVRESLPLACFAENIRIIKIKDKTAKSWWTRVGHDVFILPSELKKEKYSCVVSLTNFGPIWTSIPHVFFQRNSIYYCPRYLERVNGRLKMEAFWRRKLAVASMMRADLVVTPSQAMADMIREMCPEAASRPFKVLYHGFTKESLRDPLDQEHKDHFSTRNGIRLLYPTHPAPHKGFDALVVALGEKFPGAEIFAWENDATSVEAHSLVACLGFLPLFEKYGVKFQPLSETGWVTKPVPKGKVFNELEVPAALEHVDAWINFAKLKTNGITKTTGCLKNNFALLKTKKKSVFHGDIAPVLVDINKVVRADLNIVDGYIGMEGGGPAFGTPRKCGLLIGGKDPVAVDACCARIMGFWPRFVPHIRLAERAGIGSMRFHLETTIPGFRYGDYS